MRSKPSFDERIFIGQKTEPSGSAMAGGSHARRLIRPEHGGRGRSPTSSTAIGHRGGRTNALSRQEYRVHDERSVMLDAWGGKTTVGRRWPHRIGHNARSLPTSRWFTCAEADRVGELRPALPRPQSTRASISRRHNCSPKHRRLSLCMSWFLLQLTEYHASSAPGFQSQSGVRHWRQVRPNSPYLSLLNRLVFAILSMVDVNGFGFTACLCAPAAEPNCQTARTLRMASRDDDAGLQFLQTA
jgi:hypothetical protein